MTGSEMKEEAKECPSSHERASSPLEDIEKESEAFLQRLNIIVVDQDSVEHDPKEYRNHYETLLGALKLARGREASLVDQCHELHTQNNSKAADIQAASSSNQGLESQVEALHKDLDTVKSLLESANDREDRAKVTVEKLHCELERLTDVIDTNEIDTDRKDSDIKDLESNVEDWKSQAASSAEKISAMQIEQQKAKSQMDQIRASYTDLRESHASAKQHLFEKDDEITRGNERRERVERELEGAQSKLQAKTKDYIDMEYKCALSQNRVTSLESSLIDAKKATVAKEQDLEKETTQKMQLVEIKNAAITREQSLKEELAELEQDKKKATLSFNKLAAEKAQLERNLEAEHKIVIRHKQLVEDAKAATHLSNDEVQLLKKELDKMRKGESSHQQDLVMLKRENAVATGRIQLSEDKAKKTGQDLEHNEQLVVSLEKSLAEANDATVKQELVSRRLEGSHSSLQNQVKDSRATCVRLMDEMKMKDGQFNDFSKVVEELQSRMQIQQKQHDSTLNDMNSTLKDLTDAQREIKELEQEKKSSQRLIDTLRSEILTKDSALVKENYDYRREKVQKELYADEISRLKKSISDSEVTIRTNQTELRNLGTTLTSLENAASIQRREYDHVIGERDILGTQLIRRNDEIALLYEKIKILQSTQRRGELQYSSRLDDIRILKIKVRDLNRQLAISKGGQAGADEVNKNLMFVQKELMRERLKTKALSDELENPLNIHRWRALEGSDPQAYDLIQKIQILQRRLLQKSEEVVKKNSIIQEHEKRQLEMEQTLARRPGPEVSEQINIYQTEVRKKTKQMKAMASELNMHQSQVHEYKGEIDKLATELHNFKRKYFEQKQRETKELGMQSDLAPSSLIKPFKDQSNKARYVGGGFRL